MQQNLVSKPLEIRFTLTVLCERDYNHEFQLLSL